MPTSKRAGDLLAGRYRLIDLMAESANGRFWRAWDNDLARPVALHLIPADDARAEPLMAAARRSATLHDRHLLRVLDADRVEGLVYVVNEWGEGMSLDRMVLSEPLPPRRAAWIVSEVAELLTRAHQLGLTHGHLSPEQVLVDESGAVKVIGFAVDGALHGIDQGTVDDDVHDLAAVLYAALTGKWPGRAASQVAAAPRDHGKVLRPRQVRAGVPRRLDAVCDQVLSPWPSAHAHTYDSAQAIAEVCLDYIGDPQVMAEAERELNRGNTNPRIPRITAPLVGPDETQVRMPVTPPVTPPAAPPVAPPPTSPVTTGADETQIAATPVRDTAVAPETTPPPAIAPELDGPEAVEATATPSGPAPVDETQAGVPVFYDEIAEVGWASTSGVQAPPPPPFEEPPERPLFAPDPPEGRRPRPTPDDHGIGRDAGTGTGWANLSDQPPGHGATTGDTGAGDSLIGTGSFWPWATGRHQAVGAQGGMPDGAEDEPVPGRSWLRIAAFLALALMLAIAAVYAFNQGRDSSNGEADATAAEETSAAATTKLPIEGATDFDPQADPPSENPEQVKLAIDDDPASGWQTTTYSQPFGPGGIKDGVGLLIDLGTAQDVRQVRVGVKGSPTAVALFTATGGLAPERMSDLSFATTNKTQGKRVTLSPDQPVTARWLLLWLTALPKVDDGYRGQINSVTVSK